MASPLRSPAEAIRRVSELLRRGPQSISPTAHYTGYVWARSGLGPKELATPTGRVMFQGLQPLMAASGLIGGPTVEGFLLARHRLIDLLLKDAIDDGIVSQVVEIAAGMSPRGQRFAAEYGDRITYVEADLPAMAARKRSALEKMDLLSDHHRVVDIDALRDDGPGSLASLVAGLDAGRGIAFVTEGLLNYLSPDDVRGLWKRIAHNAVGFPEARYFSDLHLASENAGAVVRLYSLALGAFVRGQMHFHFKDVAEARTELLLAGFDEADLHRPEEFLDRLPGIAPNGSVVVRVVDARMTP
ncbi:MAG: class I SAM-dependent methyltransferase [Actinomycetota bacterium]|nr:class I SAM-dependent methyltransferase [Actinomycetota bacterium]